MQIPPTAALLNLLASLPAQGASATGAPSAAVKSPPPATPPPTSAVIGQSTTSAAKNAQAHSSLTPLPRGSLLNLVV